MYKISAFLVFVSCFTSCTIKKSAGSNFSTRDLSKKAEIAWNREIKLIEQNIKPIVFSNRDYNILDYNAKPNINEDSRPAFLACIDLIKKNQGGNIIVPAGKYKINGPIHFENNMHIKLSKGAELIFSDKAYYYLPAVKVRWEGTVAWNYSPLIYAYQKSNISITGLGQINGNGKAWSESWRKLQKPAQNKLRQMGNDVISDDERIFAGQNDSFYLRPGLLQFFDCNKILLDGSSYSNSPFWTLHFPFSNHLTIKNLIVKGGTLNDDGIDPDSSSDVLIENCDVTTHDDAIAIKAGRDQDAWQRPGTKNIIIRNCKLKSQTNAFCIGSEMSGGVSNVFVSNCELSSKEYGINLKANPDRGGKISNIYLKDLKIDTVKKSMLNFTTNYHSHRGNYFPPEFTDIYLENLECSYVADTAFKIEGLPEKPIDNIFIKNVKVKSTKQVSSFKNTGLVLFENTLVNGQEVKF